VERGLIECPDETFHRLLDSMERGIEQMASVTELLRGLASPETPDQEREEMQRKLRRLKAKYAT
jgi:hypothetical protein